MYKYNNSNQVVLEEFNRTYYVILTKSRCVFVNGNIEDPSAKRDFVLGAWEKEPAFPKCNRDYMFFIAKYF